MTAEIAVEDSWRRISSWLARHAPTTAAAIRPPAGEAEAIGVGEAVGRRLPDDLLAWWGLMDGIGDADYRAGAPIPPFYMPLPVSDVRERYASLSRFADQDCCGADGAHAKAAGQSSFGFCTATVPICWELGGDVLVVDLRDGPRHGSVMEWLAEEGYSETSWAGIAAMLADVADQLDDQTATEVVDGGALQWT
jgi:cell wall assembly regulator SMI1